MPQVTRVADVAGVGAFWGAGVWIGLTILLFVGVIIVAYQTSKRPNKR